MNICWQVVFSIVFCITVLADFDPQAHRCIQSPRSDARHVSARGIVHELLTNSSPRLQYQSDRSLQELLVWQQEVRRALGSLMRFPAIEKPSECKHIHSVQRDGYIIEKWELYPFPHSAIPFLVLLPTAATAQSPAKLPVIFCIPGSGQTKEFLAAEQDIALSENIPPPVSPNAMAYHYVQQGWITVVVDNPGTGETCDLEAFAGRKNYDDATLARFLLELDWHWLGYTSFVDQCVLDWVKKQAWANSDRIILSGFSLGTEPMMILGVLNPDIFAFVYNDFLCRTRERALVVTKPNSQGYRHAPNSIRHLVPGMWRLFDFPDIVASLAPRPIICTEGGLDRDFQLIRTAYTTMGADENFQYHHQPRFADKPRWQQQKLPDGLDRQEFFQLANVDPNNHFFKKDLVIPWIKTLLNRSEHAKQ